MKQHTEPVIEPYQDDTSSVQVSYTLDLEKFGLTQYTPEAFMLFARHAADISRDKKVKVTFNEYTFAVSEEQ